MAENIYPHIAEREAAGDFLTFAAELDGFRLRPFETELQECSQVVESNEPTSCNELEEGPA